jgi:hypothetical protein
VAARLNSMVKHVVRNRKNRDVASAQHKLSLQHVKETLFTSPDGGFVVDDPYRNAEDVPIVYGLSPLDIYSFNSMSEYFAGAVLLALVNLVSETIILGDNTDMETGAWYLSANPRIRIFLDAFQSLPVHPNSPPDYAGATLHSMLHVACLTLLQRRVY